VSLPSESFSGLGLATAKINCSTPHCCPQRFAPLPKSGVSGQILNNHDAGAKE
jgi:hypothetical protein